MVILQLKHWLSSSFVNWVWWSEVVLLPFSRYFTIFILFLYLKFNFRLYCCDREVNRHFTLTKASSEWRALEWSFLNKPLLNDSLQMIPKEGFRWLVRKTKLVTILLKLCKTCWNGHFLKACFIFIQTCLYFRSYWRLLHHECRILMRSNHETQNT